MTQQTTLTVAIQGFKGSYHEIATYNFFKNNHVTTQYCASFDNIFSAIEQNPLSTIGILAIENTIAGTLLYNNELLWQSNTKIVGEIKLRIKHCIACLPSDSLETITEINSHPIALMQCRSFIETMQGVKVVESEDTALSAQNIAENNLHHHAAICSEKAAEDFGLKILARSIETNQHNFTRFLVVANDSIAEQIKQLISTKVDKANIAFTLPHNQGCLSQVLSLLSFYKLNLTKIQSLPIIGREWEYQFFVDLTFDNHERFNQALAAVKPLVAELRNLGTYSQGETYL